MNFQRAKEEIIRYSRLIWERGYAHANAGNISARTTDGSIIITPADSIKGELAADELIVLDNAGEVKYVKGNPSSERYMHAGLYMNNKINAVIHAHPPSTVGYSFFKEAIDLSPVPEAGFIPFVAMIPYLSPGSRELSDTVSENAGDRGILVLKKHGVVAFGDTLKECFFYIDRLEYCVKIMKELRQ